MKPAELFELTAVAYLLMAWLGKFIYFNGPETEPAIYAVLFLVILLAGLQKGTNLNGRLFLFAFLLVIPLGPGYLVGGALSFFILYLLMRENLIRRAVLPALLVAIGLTTFACLRWGLPILKPELRYTEVSVPFLVAGDIIIGAIAVLPDIRFLVIGEMIAIISASRTVGLGVAVAYVLRMAYEDRLTFEEIKSHKKAVLIGIVLLLGVFLARYYVTVREYPVWKLGFMGSLLYRPASSYTVYEKLFHLGMPFGRGELLFNPDPTGYVGRLFGKHIGYTYTIFGQPAYDFGIFGLLEALILGLALGKASTNPFTGTFALTVVTLALDIGIEGQFLVAILLMAYLSEVTTWTEKT